MRILNKILGKNNITKGKHLPDDGHAAPERLSMQFKKTIAKNNRFWFAPIHGKFNLDSVSDDYFYLFI